MKNFSESLCAYLVTTHLGFSIFSFIAMQVIICFYSKLLNLILFLLFILQYCQLSEKQGNRVTNSTRCSKCLPNCPDSCTIHPVQQGEVSSTEPPLPESSLNAQNSETAAYLEAIEHYIASTGWTLLKIVSDGVIESVSENIKDLIGFTRAELQKQTIYTYLHPGDHAKLSPTFNNMSYQPSWDQDDGQSNRQIKTRIRMLVKHPEAATETMEQKQQRQDKYEEVLFLAAPSNKGMIS